MAVLILKLLFALLLPWIAGWAVISARKDTRDIPLLFKISLGYGLGMGFLSLWIFLLGVINVSFHVITISSPLFVLIILCISSALKNTSPPGKPSPFLTFFQMKNFSRPLMILSGLFCIYILYNIIFVFWRTLNIPLFVWDGYATIAYKAKVFYFNKGLIPLRHLPHSSYPLLLPLLETWISLTIGEWNDQLIKFFLPFTFVSYLCIHYYFLKTLTKNFWALFGTFLVVSSNFFVAFATVSYRDFFMLYYNCTTIFLLILWNKQRIDTYLVLAAILSGMTTFTKLEGSGYFFIHLFFLTVLLTRTQTYCFKEKITRWLTFFTPGASVWLTFTAFKVSTNVPTSGRFRIFFPWEYLDRLPDIFSKFSWNLFLTGNWSLIWIILVLCLSYLTKRQKPEDAMQIAGLLLVFFLLYFFLSWITPNYISFAGHDAIDVLPRVILHFFPLAPVLITLILFSELPQISSGSGRHNN